MEKDRDLKIPKNLYLMLQCACYFSRPMHLQFDGASLPDNVNFGPLLDITELRQTGTRRSCLIRGVFF